jgi:hypothetical protein
MARLGSLGLQLYGLKQQGDIARANQALTAKELGMKGEQLAEQKRVSEIHWGTPERIEAPAMEGGEPRVIPGVEGLEQRKMKVLEQTAEDERKKNADIENFEPLKAGRVVQKLKSLGLSEEYPLVKKIKELGWNAKITNYDAYQEIKSLYPQFRQEMGEKVIADFEKKSEANPLYAKSPEGQAQQQFIMALARDDTGDSILGAAFADTIAARQRRQAPAMKGEGFKGITVQDPNSPTGWSHLDPNQGIVIPGAPPPASAKPEKIPSAGNAIDAALMEKFGTKALTDPTLAEEGAKWLRTDEGKASVEGWANRQQAKQVTYLQLGTGVYPAVTKGVGAGTVGTKPIEGLGRPLPNETTTQLSQMKNTVSRINDLEERAKDPKMAKRFGPIEGRWTTLRQKLVEDGPTQALMNEMSGLITMAYSLSGKQISVQEMEMLKQAILPTINQPYANFFATLNMSRQWLVTQHNDTLQYFHDTGHTSNLKPLGLPGAAKTDYGKMSNEEVLKRLEGK